MKTYNVIPNKAREKKLKLIFGFLINNRRQLFRLNIIFLKGACDKLSPILKTINICRFMLIMLKKENEKRMKNMTSNESHAVGFSIYTKTCTKNFKS